MLRILHLITGFDYGGTEGRLASLVRNLDRGRFSQAVVSMTTPGGLGRELAAEGFEVHSLGMKRGTRAPRAFERLLALIREWRPQILHGWMYHANVAGLLAGRWSGVSRVVWSITCSRLDFSFHPFHTRAAAWLGGRLSRFPDLIISNSEAGLSSHADQGYDGRRMVVVANGFDTEKFKPDPNARSSVRGELELSERTPIIGMIARSDPMKGHETFLEATGLLVRQDPDVQFLLAGDKIDPQNLRLFRLVREHCPPSRIHLLGMRTDVPRLTAALDVACLSSSYGEGFPNVLGEAMSCEVPCVATDVGDSKRVLGETGIVIPPRNPAALTKAWSTLLKMGREGRAALGRAARDRITRQFSLVEMVRHHEECYRNLAADAVRS